MRKTLKSDYQKQKESIRKHLNTYKNKKEHEQLQEFLFCILTPQSNAEKCWEAITLLPSAKEHEDILAILKTRTRFYKTKAARIYDALIIWPRIAQHLGTKDKKELRDWIACTVKGFGLKEAGHFLRNIGISENKIAILDRHILRNLTAHKAVSASEIKNKAQYKQAEGEALRFSKKTGIPIDELDLLFWHKEHGRYFK
jgi:N-glycosylase/DNA lyase